MNRFSHYTLTSSLYFCIRTIYDKPEIYLSRYYFKYVFTSRTTPELITFNKKTKFLRISGTCYKKPLKYLYAPDLATDPRVLSGYCEHRETQKYKREEKKKGCHEKNKSIEGYRGTIRWRVRKRVLYDYAPSGVTRAVWEDFHWADKS